MSKPRRVKSAGWSRERWLWILLALIYVGLFVQGIAFGDWFDAPDVRRVAVAEPTLFLPTNAPVHATLVPAQALNGERKRLDINQADTWMLTAIPGVGEGMAQRIVSYRDACGGLVAVEELKRVSGVGDKLYATLIEYLEVR